MALPLPHLSQPSSGARGSLLLLFRSAALKYLAHILNASLMSVMSLPLLSSITVGGSTSLHVPSITSSTPCHLDYHLFATIFIKLSVQFFLPPYSSMLCPLSHGCLLLLAIHVPMGACSSYVFNTFYHLP